MNKWDQYFLDVARRTAELSKDRRTKVGAVIVGPQREILSTGYNGFPIGLDDEKEDRHTAPAKYLYTEHAERNAIFHGARRGISLRGTALYTTLFPCADCARAIIQVGISCVFFEEGPENRAADKTWKDSFSAAKDMLIEAGVGLFSLSEKEN